MYQGFSKFRFLWLFAVACSVLHIHGRACASQTNAAFLGLPPLVAPADNHPTNAKIALGKSLFFDKHLSEDGTISCASCHQPKHAFSDGKPLAQGIKSQLGTRNTPSLLNASYYTTLFWDGRRNSLETQALDPLLNPHEQGLKDLDSLLTLLRNDPTYVKAFRLAFGSAPNAISAAHVAKAIACFERSLVRGDSPFDRYAFKNETSNLSPAALHGLALFKGRARCVTCHNIGKKYALFTDNKFHSLGVGFTRIAKRLPILTTSLVESHKQGIKLDNTVLSNKDIAELGRFAVTLKPIDIGKFRTPSLRNVALTAPYMHDGSVATMGAAVEREIYYRSATAKRPVILTPREKDDLVEFLKTLTSANAIDNDEYKQ